MKITGENPLIDLEKVGSDITLLGIFLDTVVDICERDPVELARVLEERGLQTRIFPDGECLRSGGMLYAYHEWL